jgi:hypothetical protein
MRRTAVSRLHVQFKNTREKAVNMAARSMLKACKAVCLNDYTIAEESQLVAIFSIISNQTRKTSMRKVSKLLSETKVAIIAVLRI